MSSGLYSHTTRATGTVLTATIYNGDHVNHITNQNPLQTGAYSDTVAQMQTMTSPGGVGSESLAPHLGGELERLRFKLNDLALYLGLTAAQWYSAFTGVISAARLSGGYTATITYVIDGGGSAPTTGVKGDLLIPFACTINSVTLQADQSGSAVVDIWKKTYTLNSPPTVANTITAAALPTLATAQSSQDATLTGWTTAIAANDMLRFNLNSVTTCTRITLTLKVTKT
jgi:hypothetical protein